MNVKSHWLFLYWIAANLLALLLAVCLGVSTFYLTENTFLTTLVALTILLSGQFIFLHRTFEFSWKPSEFSWPWWVWIPLNVTVATVFGIVALVPLAISVWGGSPIAGVILAMIPGFFIGWFQSLLFAANYRHSSVWAWAFVVGLLAAYFSMEAAYEYLYGPMKRFLGPRLGYARVRELRELIGFPIGFITFTTVQGFAALYLAKKRKDDARFEKP